MRGQTQNKKKMRTNTINAHFRNSTNIEKIKGNEK